MIMAMQNKPRRLLFWLDVCNWRVEPDDNHDHDLYENYYNNVYYDDDFNDNVGDYIHKL